MTEENPGDVGIVVEMMSQMHSGFCRHHLEHQYFLQG
jgi:hypothetical protein